MLLITADYLHWSTVQDEQLAWRQQSLAHMGSQKLPASLLLSAQSQQSLRKAPPKRCNFRSATIRDYENQLRAYSSRKKMFCYFATIKVKSSAGKSIIHMTAKDFVRSMSPGLSQPEGLGLNHYITIEKDDLQKLHVRGVSKDSIFYKLRPDGMVTYADFLYLRSLVVMSEKYFEMGFKLIDKQGKQMLDKNEMSLLLFGIPDASLKITSSVKYYLFGPKLDQKLRLNQFLQFKRQLFHDIIQLEFNMLKKKCSKRADTVNHQPSHKISELRFANLLLDYSRMPKSRKKERLERTHRRYQKNPQGVTFEEFVAFFKFIQHLHTIETALTFHSLTGAGLSRTTFKHISDVVVRSPLSSHVIDILFSVFANEQSGNLRYNEFIEMARNRLSRCTIISFKLGQVLSSIYRCAERTYF